MAQGISSKAHGDKFDLSSCESLFTSSVIQRGLTSHVVTAIILLDTHPTPCSRADLRHLIDLDLARVIFHLALTAFARVVLFTCLARVHRLIVRGTHEEVARDTAEDIALDTGVVNLARGASGAHTVAEVRHAAQETAGGKLVEPIACLYVPVSAS